MKRFDSVTRSPVYASFGAMLKVCFWTIGYARKPMIHPFTSAYITARQHQNAGCWNIVAEAYIREAISHKSKRHGG